MEKLDHYRPANIEFDIANNSIVPENLGAYETDQDAIDFINKNLVGINTKITAMRFLDNFEKKELRQEYQDLLELKAPILERELMKATSDFEQAKKRLADSKEAVSANINEIKSIANEVKKGVTDINLDDVFTWRIAFKNRYYYFTYIDKHLKLAAIREIPDYEKSEIFNSMSKNEEFFENNFGVPKSEEDEIREYLKQTKAAEKYLKDEISAQQYAEEVSPKKTKKSE